ncbi:unnamed protein product [Anisakis simplex]|uniref:Large ribosomal subunit protein mL62 n=1 Tax=Anisakis simplex TaxID=6269 RepID=A0A0M3KIU3_ANISI|nr:unnamed protein product [Anisakis simplex]
MRSRGPGGQNVNMVSTKCEIRFKLSDSTKWLSKEMQHKFRSKFARFLAANDIVIIYSDKTRSQADNLADCFQKLHMMLDECLEEVLDSTKSPSEDDLKILKDRADKNATKRLEMKRKQSQKKRMRHDYTN